MKILLPILCFYTLFSLQSCTQQDDSPFKLKSKIIHIEDRVINCSKRKEGYLCLTEKQGLFCLDNNLEFDSTLLQKVKPNFEVAFLSILNDSIIASQRFSSDSFLRWFLGEDLTWSRLKSPPRRFLGNYKFLYEDEYFEASSCCVGEFGGTVFFKEKKTKKLFGSPSTCGVAVNKINGHYFLTTSLAHGSGHTEIVRITDPTKLFELPDDSVQNHCNWWTDFKKYGGYEQSMKRFGIGTEKLSDTIGITTLTSFVNDTVLYHLSVNFDKTFISTLKNGKLIEVDNLYNEPLTLWADFAHLNKNQNGFIYFINRRGVNSFVELQGDSIKTVIFE